MRRADAGVSKVSRRILRARLLVCAPRIRAFIRTLGPFRREKALTTAGILTPGKLARRSSLLGDRLKFSNPVYREIHASPPRPKCTRPVHPNASSLSVFPPICSYFSPTTLPPMRSYLGGWSDANRRMRRRGSLRWAMRRRRLETHRDIPPGPGRVRCCRDGFRKMPRVRPVIFSALAVVKPVSARSPSL